MIAGSLLDNHSSNSIPLSQLWSTKLDQKRGSLVSYRQILEWIEGQTHEPSQRKSSFAILQHRACAGAQCIPTPRPRA
jgi:hypothetical protein